VPGVRSAGIATGTFGGSRDAVATAQAAKAVSGQFAQGAAQILGQDQSQKIQAATALAGAQGQGASSGLNALGGLYGLAQGGASAALSPYQMLSQILGGPTVLGSSSSLDVASAISNSFGEQGSQSYGFDYGTSHSQSTGTGPTQGLAQSFLSGGGLAGIFEGKA
jgi:hypothetical protein